MKPFTGLLASVALLAVSSPGLSAQEEESRTLRANSLFTDGVNLPASPQAWSMNRYGNEEVDLYTGTVGHSVPVYTYTDPDFTIPVAVTYSSDGYRPNIQDGPLGLGWSLSAGGAVTREVRGIPDDTPAASECYCFQNKYYGNTRNGIVYLDDPEVYGYAYYCQEYSSYTWEDDLVRSGKLGEEYMFVKKKLRRVGETAVVPTDICYERLPDVYHFSAPGLRGRFVLLAEASGGAVFYGTEDSPDGWSVDFTLGGLGFTQFVLTSPDRHVYTYAQADMCTSTSQLSDANDELTLPGSWRLTRIDAPDGRCVVFTYGVSNFSESGQYVSSTDYGQLDPQDIDSEDGADHSYVVSGEGYTWSRTQSDCLSGIAVYNNPYLPAVCSVELDYGDDPVHYGSVKLSSVTVRNRHGRTVRRCTLSYETVQDSTTGSGVTFLRSVSVDGEGTSSFTYYGNGEGALDSTTVFPCLTTASVDWYGYYNPSVGASAFAPSMSAARNSSSDTWLLTMRQPDLAGTRLGMLRGVTYPTGGSATYEYELNSYGTDRTGLDASTNRPAAGVRVKAITLADADGRRVQRREFGYGSDTLSSGVLLQRPLTYIYYRITTTGYDEIEHRALSTTSDLFYGISRHIEYTSVTERVSSDDGGEACETDYRFASCTGGGYGNAYTGGSGSCEDPGVIFSYSHLDTELRNHTLLDRIRDAQDYCGGGRLLERAEYKIVDGARVPVRTDAYTYTPCVNHAHVYDYSAPVFCLSLYATYVYRFYTPRLTRHVRTDHAPDGGVLDTDEVLYSYDSRQRPLRVTSTDSEGNALSVRYSWDEDRGWLLTGIDRYRGGLMMSGERYEWARPDSTSCPNWCVPSTLSRAAVSLVSSDDGESETSVDWYTVASFGGYNAAGLPGTVTDALGNVTHHTWDETLLNPASVTVYPDGDGTDGLTTSWTWIPLVGPSEVTSPSGRTRRHTWDDCGRLARVADTADSTLVRHTYQVNRSASNPSWIRTRAFRTGTEYADDIMYYDGLGLPLQGHSVAAGYNGSTGDFGYDVVTPYGHDALLRRTKDWLPMPVEPGDGEYDAEAQDWGLAWYEEIYEDSDCYSETRPEFCPSGRPLDATLPGADYRLHPTCFEYLGGTIDGRSVTGVRTTDGDGRVSAEWTDREGRAVARDRVTDEGDTARTLFRYDWRGNLTQVVTPEGQSYRYVYDARGRVVSKTVPGRQAETFTYDGLDRVLTSQDGNQRSHGVTVRYSYDGAGRLLSKSAEKGGVSRPLVEYSYSPATGLKTGERVYRLTEDGWVSASDCLKRTFTYDGEERLSRVVEMDGDEYYTLTVDYTYDLAGNALSKTELYEQTVGGLQAVEVTTGRTYDPRGRLTGETVSVDGVRKSEVSYSFDELGRQSGKTYGVGGQAFSEGTAFTLQGWPEAVRGTLLNRYYHYEDSSQPSWTGDVTRRDWQHRAAANETDGDGEPASYPMTRESLHYDAMGRLSGSAVKRGSDAEDRRWSERNITYDLDGNLLTLDRYQDDPDTADLSLDFACVEDKWDLWERDDNGNFKRDPYRNFLIRYNLLNLAAVTGSCSGQDEDDNDEEDIGIVYARTECYADGTRKGVIDPVSGEWTTRYIGSLILSGEDGEEGLVGIVVPDGFIKWNGNAANSQMQYFLRDRLGSVRVIAADKDTVLGRSDYLPFGTRMSGNGLDEGTQRSSYFGFGGKENELWEATDAAGGPITAPHWLKGERYLHFGARAYDPLTCSFLQPDPMAERYYGLSPYAYCADNPVMLVDPEGASTRVYDTANRVVSELGGERVDFYYQEDGDVKVVDNLTGEFNIIEGGVDILQGAVERGDDVSWADITVEFLSGTGPDKSVFSDFDGLRRGPFASFAESNSPYGSAARNAALGSPEMKGNVYVTTDLANPVKARFDAWAQMIGQANVSWYKLGDEYLFLMLDTKSNTSLFYHLPFVKNRERGEAGNFFGNTRQIYIWIESRAEMEIKSTQD